MADLTLSLKPKLPSVLDRSLYFGTSSPKKPAEVSLSSFCFLFAEIVGYCRQQVKTTTEWEERLASIGYQVGLRTLDLCVSRDKAPKRETSLLSMLLFIQNSCWKMLFGKPASSLLENESEHTYIIVDDDMQVDRYISVPADFADLNCAAFVAGIVRAILSEAQFHCRVTAHSSENPAEFPNQRRFRVEFEPHVLARDARLNEARKK
eukprot:RCo006289